MNVTLESEHAVIGPGARLTLDIPDLNVLSGSDSGSDAEAEPTII